MTSEPREAFVYIVPPSATEAVTAGRFRWTPRDGGGLGEFVYGRSYREHPDAVEIDPISLPLSDTVFQTTGLEGFFGAIRDAMPDAWGRRVLEHRMGGAVLPEFDYLLPGSGPALVGADRMGALDFGTGVRPPSTTPTFHDLADLAGLQAAEDRIDEGNAGRSAVAIPDHALLLGTTSLGGARPKVQLRHRGDLWIAKFGSREDRWNVPRVEHGMLRLARRCGIAVPESRIESVGDRDVLLVRRFDRERAKGGHQRHRMLSAMTLLGASDALDRRRWSYLLLADQVRRVSSAPREDLRELFLRMCFNAAVSNLDDHPRNHAVVARGRDWRLSPAYDLTPTPALSLERRDLAMACGHHGRRAERGNLLSGHGRFMLGVEEATSLFDRVVETVRRDWRDCMDDAGVRPGDRSTIDRAFLYPGLFEEA